MSIYTFRRFVIKIHFKDKHWIIRFFGNANSSKERAEKFYNYFLIAILHKILVWLLNAHPTKYNLKFIKRYEKKFNEIDWALEKSSWSYGTEFCFFIKRGKETKTYFSLKEFQITDDFSAENCKYWASIVRYIKDRGVYNNQEQINSVLKTLDHLVEAADKPEELENYSKKLGRIQRIVFEAGETAKRNIEDTFGSLSNRIAYPFMNMPNFPKRTFSLGKRLSFFWDDFVTCSFVIGLISILAFITGFVCKSIVIGVNKLFS